MDLKLHIGSRVKSARKQAGLTQARLAEALDRAVETISNIERGQALPGLELLARVAEETGVPVVYFLDGFEGRRKVSPARQGIEQEAIASLQRLSDRQLMLAVRILSVLADEPVRGHESRQSSASAKSS